MAWRKVRLKITSLSLSVSLLQLEILQRQVTNLADTQSNVDDRTSRTKTEYAVLQARYHMLEEQLREVSSSIRHVRLIVDLLCVANKRSRSVPHYSPQTGRAWSMTNALSRFVLKRLFSVGVSLRELRCCCINLPAKLIPNAWLRLKLSKLLFYTEQS